MAAAADRPRAVPELALDEWFWGGYIQDLFNELDCLAIPHRNLPFVYKDVAKTLCQGASKRALESNRCNCCERKGTADCGSCRYLRYGEPQLFDNYEKENEDNRDNSPRNVDAPPADNNAATR